MRNADFLDWIDEDEREHCPACGTVAVVGVAEAPTFRVCLACAAVWLEGERLDDEQGRLRRSADAA
jgi:Zn-finger nucleic acid-binding protein